MGITGDYTKRAAGHLQELSILLSEAQDGGHQTTDYLRSIVMGSQILLSAIAEEIDNVGDDLNDFAEDAQTLRKQTEGGAE
jgi:hypothetical protein